MNGELSVGKDAAINRNIKLSVFLGPIRMLAPALLNLVLYALLIKSGGIELIGFWASIQLILFYVGAFDLGFGKLIPLEIAAGSMPSVILEDHFRALIGLYLIGGLVLICLVLCCAQSCQDMLGDQGLKVYGISASELLIAVTVSAVLTMVCNLQSAILIGNHKLYYVQSTEILQSVTQFIVSVIGVILGYPVYGLVTGLFFSILGKTAATSFILHRYHPDHFWLRPRFASIISVVRLARRARYFSLLYMTEYFRYPMVRLIILSTLGTVALGVYDLANKIPQMLRDAFGSGLSAIFPAFSSWRFSNADSSVRALQMSLVYISTTSVLLLGVYYAFCGEILLFWIGSGSRLEEIYSVTRVLTAWWLISSYMIPYWWAALGSGFVRFCSILYCCHVVVLIVVWTIGRTYGFSLVDYAWILLVSGFIVQCVFLIYFENKSRMVSLSLADKRTRIIAAFSIVLSFVILVHSGFAFVVSPAIDRYLIVGMFALYLMTIAVIKRHRLLTAIRHIDEADIN
jgi:O-antigen/teichoic acid export membrane protein